MRYSDIEVRLFEFLQAARTARLPVTRKTLAARALSIRDKLLDAATDESTKTRLSSFGASSRWLTGFVSRHALRSTHLHGEAGSVKVSELSADIEAIRIRLQDFRPEFINIDETGLFSNCLLTNLHSS